MALHVTFHGNRPKGLNGAEVDALGPQIGDSEAVTDSFTPTESGMYRCRADADHRVRFDAGSSAASTGELWGSGTTEVRVLQAGEVIKVGAAS